jgi:hypothetical protein
MLVWQIMVFIHIIKIVTHRHLLIINQKTSMVSSPACKYVHIHSSPQGPRPHAIRYGEATWAHKLVHACVVDIIQSIYDGAAGKCSRKPDSRSHKLQFWSHTRKRVLAAHTQRTRILRRTKAGTLLNYTTLIDNAERTIVGRVVLPSSAIVIKTKGCQTEREGVQTVEF